MTVSHQDQRLWAGIELFNTGEYFACHDVWEELWNDTVGPERDFIKGLIHVTVALHHFTEGNPGGGRKMSRSAIKYLSNFPGVYLQLDIASLLKELDRTDWHPDVAGCLPQIQSVCDDS